MKLSTRSTASLPSLAVFSVAGLGGASISDAAIIHSGPIDLTITQNGNIYFELDPVDTSTTSFASHNFRISLYTPTKPYMIPANSGQFAVSGGLVERFALDDAIGSSLNWTSGFTNLAFMTLDPWAGSNIEGYIGLRLDDGGGNFRYGWAELVVTNTDDFSAELTLREFAVNSTPNESIAAGAIPEPSSVALLVLGAGGLAARRRRKA